MESPLRGLVPADTPEQPFSMKPILAKILDEALVRAIARSIPDISETRMEEIILDIHSVTKDEWLAIDPEAIAQNLCVVLFGPGGWTVNGVYGANATVHETVDAVFSRPHKNPLGDIVNFLSSMPCPDSPDEAEDSE